jgi:hypothetical protein
MSEEVVQEAALSGPALAAARKRCEEKIYKAFKILDKTGQNTEYYKKKFASMTDKQFLEFFKQDFPLKFQTKVFEVDPTMEEIADFLTYIKVPILERVKMPFLYTNKNGEAVSTQEILVVYIPIKRLKQFAQKKSGYSVDIAKRDYRTGLLVDTDSNGGLSDREIESMVVFGLDKSLREMVNVRAENMHSKMAFYSQLNTTGMAALKDVDIDSRESIARNLISAYLLGAHLKSNLVMEGDYLKRSLEKKSSGQQGVKRRE